MLKICKNIKAEILKNLINYKKYVINRIIKR